MKKKRRTPILLVVAALTLCLACAWVFPGKAAGESSPPSCRYFYQLVKEASSDGTKTDFSLYLDRSMAAGTPLISGVIALTFDGVDSPDDLSFTPETGWATREIPANSAAQGETPSVTLMERGVANGAGYMSFGWYWNEENTTPPGAYGDNPCRQRLGTVTVSQPDVQLDNAGLVPWPQTTNGAAIIAHWQTSADPDAVWELIRNIWRISDIEMLNQGYFQGFYPVEATQDNPLTLLPVDLSAGWMGFTIGAYAPGKDITLYFFQTPEGGPRQLRAVAKQAFGAGSGYFTGRIDFPALHYTDKDGNAIAAPDGTYELVITKPSHVTCSIGNVRMQNGDCLALMGVHLELPCGDIDVRAQSTLYPGSWLGNGKITQTDRDILQSYLHGGAAVTPNQPEIGGEINGAYYADLSGDGRISLTDLEILVADDNYNRRSMDFSDPSQVGG